LTIRYRNTENTLHLAIPGNSDGPHYAAPFGRGNHRSPEMKRQAAIAYAAALEVLG
jgi:hypothetical protein